MESIQTVGYTDPSIALILFLFQNMLGKETEILEAREKAKIDFDKKLRLIQREVEQNDELKSRVKQLESDLTGRVETVLFVFLNESMISRSTFFGSKYHSSIRKSCCRIRNNFEST